MAEPKRWNRLALAPAVGCALAFASCDDDDQSNRTPATDAQARTATGANRTFERGYILRDCAERRAARGVDGLSCEEANAVLGRWGEPPQLTPCRGYSLRVSEQGVTCEEATRFIHRDFAPHPGGWVERKGPFTCRIRQFDGVGGLHVQCTDGSGWFAFRFG